MTSWCKVAADLDCHPKIRKAGRDGREVFLFILRRNAMGDYEGRLPVLNVDPDYLADQLMMDEVTVRNGLSRACNAGLLRVTDRHVLINGWESEWSKTAMSVAERQARHRKKLKEEEELAANSNGASRDVTGVTVEESRLDKKRIEESVRAASPRNHTIPDSWKPSDSEQNRKAEATAKARGVNLETELERMRDWSKGSGSKGKKADWDATWRNWTRSANRTNGNQQESGLDAALRIAGGG